MQKDLENQPNEQGPEYAVDYARLTLKNLSQMSLQRNDLSLLFTEAPRPKVPDEVDYDYGVNMSAVSEQLGRPPNVVASMMATVIKDMNHNSLVQEATAIGPFLNFRVDMAQYGNMVLNQVLEMASDYGKENEGDGRIVVIDMSSPNIAKRMTYGHLRSTIIGDALRNLYSSQGYDVIRDNHIGDWGTQFGKLIVAINTWGNIDKMLASDDPIGALQEVYVKFHDEVEVQAKPLVEKLRIQVEKDGVDSLPGLSEAIERTTKRLARKNKIDPKDVNQAEVMTLCLRERVDTPLEVEGRKEFLKLEKGDEKNRELWKLCIDLSMKEFNRVYGILGVDFEETLGESFYEGMLQDVFTQVLESQVGSISDGALVIDMTDKKLGVAIVQKTDGASIYMTRDLAAAIYREEELKADKVIYVVGDDQQRYFKQLFEALRRLGYKVGENAEHVYFGMVSLPEGKMSTRKGRVVLLQEVINTAMEKAESVLMSQEKNKDLDSNPDLKQKIIRQIAIGALKWNDLSQDAKKSIVYNLDKAIRLEGNSAPYVQYTAIRAKSILTASGVTIDSKPSEVFLKDAYSEPSERALIRQLAEYPNVLREATKTNNPARVAAYVYELAKRFNSFYTNKKTHVLKAESPELVNARLKLVAASSQVVTNALNILGIEVPERM